MNQFFIVKNRFFSQFFCQKKVKKNRFSITGNQNRLSPNPYPSDYPARPREFMMGYEPQFCGRSQTLMFWKGQSVAHAFMSISPSLEREKFSYQDICNGGENDEAKRGLNSRESAFLSLAIQWIPVRSSSDMYKVFF